MEAGPNTEADHVLCRLGRAVAGAVMLMRLGLRLRLRLGLGLGLGLWG